MRHRGLQLVLVIATLAVNWPILSAGEVYEDRTYTQPSVSLRWEPSRMLTGYTWALQADQSDRARHAVNLSVHLLNGVLVGSLAASLGLSAWLVMGLFLLHPIQSEAAGYLAARADLLMTMCLLLMACALVRGWWLAACGCALLAMGCKEIGVAAVGIAAIWPGRPRWMVGVVTGLAALGLAAALTLIRVYGSVEWIRQQAAGLGGQLTGLIAPGTLMLAPDPVPYSWAATGALFVACALVLVWAWRSPVRRLAALWIVSCLVLRFVIPTPQSVLNSHQMYAAMVGICLWIGTLHADHAVQ